MTRSQLAASWAVLFLFGAGCASTTSAPRIVEPLTADLAGYSSASVSVSAAEAVDVAEAAQARVTRKIRDAITRTRTGWVGLDSPGQVHVEVELTRYDPGSAFARAMLAGLGQIHIDGRVVVTASETNERLGVYEVSKTFAWGGIYGAGVTIETIEDTFAESVANGLVQH